MSDDLVKQITVYLSNGGLFNPEMMDHDKVRNLLMDCRDRIEHLEAINLKAACIKSEDVARIEQLEAALQSIAANTCCDKCQEAALVARAALADTQNKSLQTDDDVQF